VKPTDRQRRNIVARILAKETTPEAEAQRFGISARTIYRWVEDAKAAAGQGPESVSKTTDTNVSQETSGNVTPPGKTPSDSPNDAEKRALEAAGETSGPVNAPAAAPIAVDQARVDMENYCIEAYGGFKSAVGATLVQWNYSPPLEVDSPEVLKLLKVGAVASTAIRTNAPKLYPILVKAMSGWVPLIVAIGADSLGMMLGLGGLARSKGWEPPEKEDKGDDAPKKKKVFDFAAARKLQQELEDRKAEAGTVDVGSTPRQMDAPRPK